MRARAFDAYCRWRNAFVPRPEAIRDVVLIAIDDESQRYVGQKWPWNRKIFAEFLDRLTDSPPRLILFDLVFAGEGDPSHDRAFAEAIRRSPAPVLLACYLDQRGEPILPLSLFTEAGGMVGLINKPRDADLRIRRMFAGIHLPLQGRPLYAMEVMAAALAKGIPLDRLDLTLTELALGSSRIPLKVPGTLAINWSVDRRHVQEIPFWRVLHDDGLAKALGGKVVLIGATSEVTHDVYPTPLGLMPGVLIILNGFLTLLSERFLTPLPWPLGLSLGIGLTIASCWLTYALPPLWGIWAAVGLAIGGTILGFLALVLTGHETEYFSVWVLAGLGWLTGTLYRYFLLVWETIRLHRQVVTDPASGLFTSRYFFLRLDRVWSDAMRMHKPRHMSLVVIQTDPFTQLLHQMDWAQLQEKVRALGDLIHRLCPQGGLAGRLGEDRFAVLLFGMDMAQAQRWAQQLLPNLDALNLPGSCGVGVISFVPRQADFPSMAHWVRCAMTTAIRAKNRATVLSCVEIFDPQRDIPSASEFPDRISPAVLDPIGYVASEWEEKHRALEKALSDLRKAYQEMETHFLEVTKALVTALESKDEYTSGHLERVSRYACRLAEVLQLPPQDVRAIREAALLHDIGKIGLPDEVLHKVGPLTEEEKAIIKQHLQLGARILEPMKFFKPITTLIYHHHERYDGKGYPHGLVGDLIPPGAQIIAIADAFDAMTTHRGYNKPLTVPQALEELRKGAGTQFHPAYGGCFRPFDRARG